MFGLSIVKTADLNSLKARVADLETDADGALDKVSALERKYNNLADQVQRSDNSVRESLAKLDSAVIAKPEVCPLLTAVPKHVTDPVGAWESKQRVLELRLKTVTDLCSKASSLVNHWRGVNLNVYLSWNHQLSKYSQEVECIKQELYAHQICKPTVVQLAPPSETAVVVKHKKYGTIGLLKGKHITILSNGGKLTVGDVILNIHPNTIHNFWDIIPAVDEVTFNV